jgi:hypothetical protein
MLSTWQKLSLVEKQKMGVNARRCYDQHFEVNAVINRFQEVLFN